MSDDPASVSPDEIVDALAFALRDKGGKRAFDADQAMARIAADRLVRHLQAWGFVQMKGSPATAPRTSMNGAETTVRPKFIDMLATRLFPGKPNDCGPRYRAGRVRRDPNPEDGKRRCRCLYDIITDTHANKRDAEVKQCRCQDHFDMAETTCTADQYTRDAGLDGVPTERPTGQKAARCGRSPSWRRCGSACIVAATSRSEPGPTGESFRTWPRCQRRQHLLYHAPLSGN